MAPELLAVLLVDEKSAGRIARLGRQDGRLLGETRLPAGDFPALRHPMEGEAGLIAADGAHLLWWHQARLVCEKLMGGLAWEMDLPSACKTVTHWRPRSHLSCASVAVHRGAILLRDGPRVLVDTGPVRDSPDPGPSGSQPGGEATS